ncbi:hypothetical protein [Reinekea sp. G2M2-21]|uniref:hypothetical protein n=1 Tax=Reinekea sp. G2M2-21 TaxID=2788942 RepID=UPI0018AA7B1B|nr:hypothetical protein [Reinekea sp. G2M2-21]
MCSHTDTLVFVYVAALHFTQKRSPHYVQVTFALKSMKAKLMRFKTNLEKLVEEVEEYEWFFDIYVPNGVELSGEKKY